MSIDIICPLYNAEDCILSLDKSLKNQKKVNLCNIVYILTEGKDESEKILKNNKISGCLQIPYLIWLLFATYLNIGIFLLN